MVEQFASLHFLFEDDSLDLARQRHHQAKLLEEKLESERTALNERILAYRKAASPAVLIPNTSLPLSERILLYRSPLSAKQVAAEVGVDRNTIYRWSRAETIPARRTGRHLKFDQGPLAGWVKKRESLALDQW